MTFLSTLRALDARATPGPIKYGGPVSLKSFLKFPSVGDPLWEVGPGDDSRRFTSDGLAAFRHESDAKYYVALRNRAPRIAAVVEAAEMMPVGPALEDEPGPYVLVHKDDLRALRDALYALDKEDA